MENITKTTLEKHSKAAIIKDLMPFISLQKNKGLSNQEIYDSLDDDIKLKVNIQTFNVYVNRFKADLIESERKREITSIKKITNEDIEFLIDSLKQIQRDSIKNNTVYEQLPSQLATLFEFQQSRLQDIIENVKGNDSSFLKIKDLLDKNIKNNAIQTESIKVESKITQLSIDTIQLNILDTKKKLDSYIEKTEENTKNIVGWMLFFKKEKDNNSNNFFKYLLYVVSVFVFLNTALLIRNEFITKTVANPVENSPISAEKPVKSRLAR
jgi:hypothetical protein